MNRKTQGVLLLRVGSPVYPTMHEHACHQCRIRCVSSCMYMRLSTTSCRSDDASGLSPIAEKEQDTKDNTVEITIPYDDTPLPLTGSSKCVPGPAIVARVDLEVHAMWLSCV